MTRFYAAPPDWNTIPQLELIGDARCEDSSAVKFETSGGPLTVSLHEFGARFQFGMQSCADYGILTHERQGEPVVIESLDGQTVIRTKTHRLELTHTPFSFRLFKGERLVQQSPTDSHFVRRFRLPPCSKVEDGWLFSIDLDSNAHVYGLGEKWSRLDHRGELIRSFNHDALGVNAEISYKNTPFAWSPDGWGIFVHTPAPVTHGVGYAPWSQRAYALLTEDQSNDIFILSGDTGHDLITDYTALTGRSAVPPDWSLGVILSKAYYKDADELLATAQEVRKRKMPCDTITIDGRAWQDTDTRFAFEWDPTRYPDPKVVIDQLKHMNFKVCVWEYPLVSVKNPLFDKMDRLGWLLKDSRTGETYRYQWDTSPFGEVLTPLPDSGIVDFTHPDAYAFWRDAHKPLFDLGIDMIKADFGEQIEPFMQAHNGDSGDILHNAYTLLYNRCVYEAASRYCKTGAFLFTRSCWAGSQRYPSQWGGDPQADWGGLAGSIRGGLSWGLSGGAFFATDVGGFYDDRRDPELYARWTQAAVFSAHIRLHGIGQREPWSYGAEAESAATKALKLRYQLLPYIKNTVADSSRTGLPVQRAMCLACPKEKAAWGYNHQFMFGEDILFAPVINPGGTVECYLPATISKIWRRFPCGTIFEGGRSHSLTLQLDEMAVFVPESRAIPLGPEIETLEQAKGEIISEQVWRAEAAS